VIIETPKGSANKYAFDHQQRILSRQRLSAGVAHDFAAHEARLIGGEQHIGRRKFGGLARTTHRNVGAELHQVLRRLAADWVGATPLTRIPLPVSCLGQAFHEESDGSLGHRVVENTRRRILGIDGGGTNNGRAGFEVRQGGLKDPEHGVHVGAKRRMELFSRDVE
jgi:hypothetical protein